MSLAEALRAQASILEALAQEAEAREHLAAPGSTAMLTDREVAELLHVHPSDVCRFRKQGSLPAVYLGKRRPRTRRDAVEKFLEARTRA